MIEVEIGHVSDYFSHPMVAGIDLEGELKKGDRIHILGHTTDLDLIVASMQIEHDDVEQAGIGQPVGIKVPERVRKGDRVYRYI